MNWSSVLVRAAFVGLLLATTSTALAQDLVPLFNGKNTKGWKADHIKAKVVDGVLRVGDGRGWLRHETVFNDFVLIFEARLIGQGARGGVIVRAWPVVNETSVLRTSYQLSLAATATSSTAPADAPADGRPVPATSSQVRVATTAAAGSWHRVEIECLRDSVSVRLDGETIIADQTVQSPQGFLGFWADAGFVELRSIQIRELPLPDPIPPAGVYSMKEVTGRPSVVQEVKPAYTEKALRAGIAGDVMLEVVVLANGLVGDIKIRRSLDPIFGLDLEAIRAARQWRFLPATLNGQPVPVMVSIALSFEIKR